MNKSVQGLWARKTRVNLNAATPPPGSAAAAALQQQSSSSPSRPASSLSREKSAPPPDLDTANVVDETQIASSSTQEPLTNGKRKSRTTEGSSKRLKPAGAYMGRSDGAGSSKDKDYSPPTARLSDLGGVQTCVEKILELVAMPITHPEVYIHTGVQPPRGVLLHGPPGCGKTLLAHAIAGELGVPFISISAPSIVSGMSGESEKTLREAFEEAQKHAPCILFIDEIDAITPKRESAQREMERRIVAQFLTCMDELSWEKTGNKSVVVIGATNRPDSLDTALRRAGRFDHEISMSVPDEIGREQILRVQAAKLRLSGDFDFRALAKATPGYVGADLGALTGAAGVIAVKRIFRQLAADDASLPTPSVEIPAALDETDILPVADSAKDVEMAVDEAPSEPVAVAPPPPIDPEKPLPISTISSFLSRHPDPLTPSQLDPLTITYSDFIAALSQVQPSSKREGFATIPDVTWSDVGALHATREELQMAIVQPIRRPEVFKAVGITAPCGVLLWGPPGCGKTLLAKAVANESRANFISVKGPELLNKYVGESERAVRQVFMRAASSSPCVVFFDELDALVPRRDDSLSESSARVVNTLLTELDGLSARKDVYVIAATNRPDMIDPAMCRPGRLDKLLYVDLPNADERAEIVRTVLRGVPIAPSSSLAGPSADTTVDEILNTVRVRCEGYSGADLAALVREAGVLALRETLRALDASGFDSEPFPSSSQQAEAPTVHVTLAHVNAALEKVVPSVSVAQRRKYEALRSKFAGLPVRGGRREREREREGAGTGAGLGEAGADGTGGLGGDGPGASIAV